MQQNIGNSILKVLVCPHWVLYGIQDGVQDGRRPDGLYTVS